MKNVFATHKTKSLEYFNQIAKLQINDYSKRFGQQQLYIIDRNECV